MQITYPGSGNNTQFTIDCLGRTSKIEERTAGSVTSTKLHLWGGASRIEERDASGSLSNGKQFFAFGQRNFSSGVGSSYCYVKDNPPGSIRELTDSSGAVSAQYVYNPYGQVAKIQGAFDADFQYAGYYAHPRSGMFFTATRAYSPNVGRFISRDVIEEKGGLNLYAYVQNNPIRYVDPQGTDGTDPDFPDTIKNSPGCLKWSKDTSNLIDCPTERNNWFLQCVRKCNQKIPPPKQQVKGPVKQNPWAAPSPGNARVPAPPDMPWWTFLLGVARAAAAAAAAAL